MLTCLQYGITVGQSTDDAFFDLNKNLNDSITKKKKKELTHFLGFAKAFNSIDRDKLLNKFCLF